MPAPALRALSRAGAACVCARATRGGWPWAVGASPSWGAAGVGNGTRGKATAGAGAGAGAGAVGRGRGGPRVAPAGVKEGEGDAGVGRAARKPPAGRRFAAPPTQRTEFYYWHDLRAMLMHKLNLTDPRKVPELSAMKITCTQNDIVENGPKRSIPALMALLLLSGGQRPSLLRAASANNRWGVRAGAVLGGSVTVRGRRMYDALEIVVNAMLPALRDFKGVPDSKISARGATVGFGITSGSAAPQLNAHPAMFEGRVTGFLIELSLKNCRNKEDAVLLLRGLQVPIVPATKADLAKKNPVRGRRGRD